MKFRALFLVLTLIFSFLSIFSQGTISGTVTDKETKETLIGATVILEGTTKGTITDFEGRYTLTNIPEGNYNVICSYISYENMVQPNVIINSGEESAINFTLKESSIELEDVVVVGKKNRESEQLLLMERKESTVAVESIGAKELSQKGVSNVAAGVKKISGVSMIGNKQLFVRGLGDRYNAVQLNGLPLPSPDPTKKVIKLDIFSTDIVEALSVSKVLNVKNYADYTGALIDIETKDYPLIPFISIEYGIGVNTNSTFNDFSSMHQQSNDFSGLDIKERKGAIPNEYRIYNYNSEYNFDPFKTDMTYSTEPAMPNQSFSISGGKLFNRSFGQIGILVSSSFENGYVIEPEAFEAYIRRDGTNFSSFNKSSHVYSTNFSNLLSLNYKINNEHSIAYNLVFLNSSENKLNEKIGRDYENHNLFVRYGEFVSSRLISNQLLGQHKLSDKLTLDWAGGYSIALNDYPDTRSVVLENRNNNWYYFTLNAQETMRISQDLDEQDFAGKVSLEYTLNEQGKIFVGSQTRFRNRTFDAYFYYYDVDGISDQSTNFTDAANLINDDNFSNESVSLTSGTLWGNKYDASLSIIANYLDFVYTFFDKLTIDLGIRNEISNMIIQPYRAGFLDTEVPLKKNDFFPALNTRYKIAENANIRMALSRTITRPSFNEKSPSEIVPEYGKPLETGEENLVNSYSNNVDVKFEIFPNPGELYSIGVYAKQIEDPIERVSIKSGGNFKYTYKNTNKGIATGVEVEGKKKIKDFFAGFNAAYIYTQIKIPENSNETNKERALQGASPFLINADLGYQLDYGKNVSSIAFVYNVYGQRIWAVGADGIGDTYEEPYHTFDIVLRNKLFNQKFDVNFKVKNILNSTFQLTQDYYSTTSEELIGTKKIYQYKKGIEFSLSLGYKF